MLNNPELLARLSVEPEKMTDTELLACILSKNPGTAHLKAAAKLVNSRGLVRESSRQYSTRLTALAVLGKRLASKPAGCFLKPKDVWDALPEVRGAKKEHFLVFYLDTRNNEIKRETVSIGTLNYNVVHPREVFEPAVRNLAAGVIVAHNHPSGCLEPSDEDLSLTKRLCQAGKLLGIEVLDHVIITRDAFSSFKQKNLM